MYCSFVAFWEPYFFSNLRLISTAQLSNPSAKTPFRRRPEKSPQTKAYGQSKTANSLFSTELDRRGKPFGIRAFAVHPGRIPSTNLKHSLTIKSNLRCHCFGSARSRSKTFRKALPLRSGQQSVVTSTAKAASIAPIAIFLRWFIRKARCRILCGILRWIAEQLPDCGS